MTIEEFYQDLESFIPSLFNIEKSNLPRSQFAGIRSGSRDNSSGDLKNKGFSYSVKIESGRIKSINFKINTAKYKYAEYINSDPNKITSGYWEKIQKDIAQRISSRYNGVIIG
jgi:hypothetical protein